MFTRWPIRRQILTLVAILVIPLAGLLVYGAYDRMQLRRLESEQAVQNIAALVETNLVQLTTHMEDVLHALSHLPVVRRLSPGACTPMATSLRSERRLFSDATIHDRRGQVICSAFGSASTVSNVAEEGWFQEAAASPGFHVSEPHQVDDARRWVLMYSYPIRDERQQVVGFFALALDLAMLSNLLVSIPQSETMSIKVLNERGMVIARSRDPERWIGTVNGNAPEKDAIRSGEIIEARGLDNVQKVYAVRTMDYPAWSVRVGVPVAAISGPVKRQLTRGAVVTVTVSLLAIAVGMLVTYQILRPVRRLVETMARNPGQLDVARFRENSSPEIAAIAAEYADTVALRREAERREHMLAQVFETAQESMMIMDAKYRIVAVNRAFEEDTGYPASEAIGKNPAALLRSEQHDHDFYRQIVRDLEASGRWNGEIWNRRRTGEGFPCFLTVTRFRDEDDQIIHVGVMLDISRQKAIEQKLEHASNHDPLTGLPNRYLLLDRLQQSLLLRRQHPHQHVAVLLIDLDRFKYINDTLGHPAGDAMLVMVSQRLHECLRAPDTISRLGGDEFAIVVPELETPDVLLPMIRRMFHAMQTPFHVDGHDARAAFSMGIALHPNGAEDATTMLRYADAALHRAKAEGGNRYAFHAEAMTRDARRRFSLENDLRKALDERQFFLVFEPQYQADGRLAGCEALIRWKHPLEGLIPPLEFIPILEDIGLMNEVSEWVIEEACRQLAEWRDNGVPVPRVAVNLSARKLDESDLGPLIESATSRLGLAVSDVELEITEGALMEQPEKTSGKIRALQETGVRVAIDDFGTGYSSLAYLKLFSANVVKIDRSFIIRINEDTGNQEIVRAVVAMGHAMQMEVLAEGIETAEEYGWLRREGCDLYQGHLFSPPVTANAMRGERLRFDPDSKTL